MTIRVRLLPEELTDDHVDILDDLDRTCFPDERLYEKRDPDEYVRLGGELRWWLAYDGSSPVAFAGLRWWPEHGVHYLTRSGVSPTHRGLGLQTRLIRSRCALARKNTASNYVQTYTVIDNPASINSLIRCGFRAFVPTWHWGFKDALYLRLPLHT